MADPGAEFSFFQGIRVRTDIFIFFVHHIWHEDTSRKVNSNETNQTGTGDVIKSRSREKPETLYIHHQSAFGHQTWQDDNLL